MPKIHVAIVADFPGFGPSVTDARLDVRRRLVAAGKDWDYGHIPIIEAELAPFQQGMLEIVPCRAN